jgi:hypothetical protein
MKSEARMAIALFGGAAILVFAVGCGGKSASSTTTTTTTTTTTPSVHGDRAPAAPSAPGGCIPHVNC